MDKKYIACVKLLLNRGRLKVTPGTIIFLTDSDIADGLNIDNLLKNGGIVEYESDKQAEEIKKWWESKGRLRREAVRADNLRRRK